MRAMLNPNGRAASSRGLNCASPRAGTRPSVVPSRGLRPVVPQVAGLDPDLAALRTGFGLQQRAAGWEPQPGLRLEAFAALIEIAVQHQHLDAARDGHGDRRSGSPAL